MPKRCNICSKEAVYQVKSTSDFYCQECAEEQFGDVALLVKVEDQAVKLKKAVDQKLNEVPEEECECEPEGNSEDNEDN